MKLNLSVSLLLSAGVLGSAATTKRNKAFTPYRIHYDDLVVGQQQQQQQDQDRDRDGGNISLLEALEESSGMISLTDLPNNFSTIKKEVMAHLHSCLVEQQEQQQHDDDTDEKKKTVVVAEQAFKDGTVRRTFATATTVEDGQLPLHLPNTKSSSSSSCRLFNQHVHEFRTIADQATKKFATVLSRELEPYLLQPLLTIKKKKGGRQTTTDDDDDSSSSSSSAVYNTIDDLVTNGDILEHFHSYQKIRSSSKDDDDEQQQQQQQQSIGGEVYNDNKDDDGGATETMTTIDLHADQGFFIAFTPGMMVGTSSTTTTSGGFYIVEENDDDDESSKTKKKNPIHVDFDLDNDDLVFMLGDGVNQYINNRMVDSNHGRRRALRATPHAVSLKYHDVSAARVWYGRMVLPPQDALVALAEDDAVQTTLTYGDVRRRLVEISLNEDASSSFSIPPMGLGCSSPTMRALQGGVHEEPSACEKGTLFCWARCMELEPYDLTEETCQDQNLDMKCINPRGQYQTGERHGDFWPACTNTTQEVTAYPEILQHDDEVCTTEAWTAFMSSSPPSSFEEEEEEDATAATYDHTFDLTTESNDGAALQWSVIDEERGIIRGRLVFGDVFGWLGFGFAAPDGKHNGMNDGNIIMALPGGNYTPAYGMVVPGMTVEGSDEISIEVAKSRSAELLPTTTNPPGSTVYEYHIDPDGSSFRHWSEPTGSLNDDDNDDGQRSANVIVTDCFTAMTFETNSINGKAFNVSGTDDVIWAGNSMDYHAGYHGRGNRARFIVNWKTGEGQYWEKPVVIGDDHDDHDHTAAAAEDDHDDNSGAHRRSGSSLLLISIVAVAITTYLF